MNFNNMHQNNINQVNNNTLTDDEAEQLLKEIHVPIWEDDDNFMKCGQFAKGWKQTKKDTFVTFTFQHDKHQIFLDVATSDTWLNAAIVLVMRYHWLYQLIKNCDFKFNEKMLGVDDLSKTIGSLGVKENSDIEIIYRLNKTSDFGNAVYTKLKEVLLSYKKTVQSHNHNLVGNNQVNNMNFINFNYNTNYINNNQNANCQNIQYNQFGNNLNRNINMQNQNNQFNYNNANFVNNNQNVNCQNMYGKQFGNNLNQNINMQNQNNQFNYNNANFVNNNRNVNYQNIQYNQFGNNLNRNINMQNQNNQFNYNNANCVNNNQNVNCQNIQCNQFGNNLNRNINMQNQNNQFNYNNANFVNNNRNRNNGNNVNNQINGNRSSYNVGAQKNTSGDGLPLFIQLEFEKYKKKIFIDVRKHDSLEKILKELMYKYGWLRWISYFDLKFKNKLLKTSDLKSTIDKLGFFDSCLLSISLDGNEKDSIGAFLHKQGEDAAKKDIVLKFADGEGGQKTSVIEITVKQNDNLSQVLAKLGDNYPFLRDKSFSLKFNNELFGDGDLDVPIYSLGVVDGSEIIMTERDAEIFMPIKIPCDASNKQMIGFVGKYQMDMSEEDRRKFKEQIKRLKQLLDNENDPENMNKIQSDNLQTENEKSENESNGNELTAEQWIEQASKRYKFKLRDDQKKTLRERVEKKMANGGKNKKLPGEKYYDAYQILTLVLQGQNQISNTTLNTALEWVEESTLTDSKNAEEKGSKTPSINKNLNNDKTNNDEVKNNKIDKDNSNKFEQNDENSNIQSDPINVNTKLVTEQTVNQQDESGANDNNDKFAKNDKSFDIQSDQINANTKPVTEQTVNQQDESRLNDNNNKFGQNNKNQFGESIEDIYNKIEASGYFYHNMCVLRASKPEIYEQVKELECFDTWEKFILMLYWIFVFSFPCVTKQFKNYSYDSDASPLNKTLTNDSNVNIYEKHESNENQEIPLLEEKVNLSNNQDEPVN